MQARFREPLGYIVKSPMRQSAGSSCAKRSTIIDQARVQVGVARKRRTSGPLAIRPLLATGRLILPSLTSSLVLARASVPVNR